MFTNWFWNKFDEDELMGAQSVTKGQEFKWEMESLRSFHISFDVKFWSEVLFDYLLLSILPNTKVNLLLKQCTIEPFVFLYNTAV